MFEMKNIQGEEKDMTLLAYQVFLAVVEQESFQKAAQVLNLTPSAISHAVASMETELGSDVYKRQVSRWHCRMGLSRSRLLSLLLLQIAEV